MRSFGSRISVALTLAALATTAWAQLGLDLTPSERKPDARAKPPVAPDARRKVPTTVLPELKLEPKTQAPVTMPELDVSARSGEGGKRLAEANRVFASGDFQTAALAYDAILREPALAESHDEARYQLAKSLIRLDLDAAALTEFDDLLSKGPQGTKYFANALEWLFEIAKKTGDESVIVSKVARYAGASAFPAAQADRYSYVLARYSYERGQALDDLGRRAEAKKAWDEARRLATAVRSEAGAAPQGAQGGDVYARAKFLEGLIQYAEGQQQAAVDSFREVVRLTNPKRARAPDLRLRELAFLQLARIHYEHKQNRYAIFYYDRMPWGGESWLEGLWEASWAHYRIGDYEKALGNLLTLQSPYFRDEWFPESWILKAIIYYENCRYPEARSILDQFNGTYEGVLRELDGASGLKPASLLELIEDVEKSGAARGQVTRRVMKVAFTDRTVKQLTDAVVRVERENAALSSGSTGLRDAFRGSPLARDLRDRLGRERGRLVEEAGARARARIEFERDTLRDLLQQALRIKIEVARREREALEVALSRGEPVDVVRDYRYSVAVSDEHLYWPYDGEFWRDELGTYTYTLTKGCRDTGARSSR